MRRALVLVVVLFSMLYVSCESNGTSIKAVEEGKIAIVSKEYEKSRDLFKLAVNEDSKNIEAKLLFDLTNNYIELRSMIDKGNFDNVEELISKIEKNDKFSIIEDEFKKIKETVIKDKKKFSEAIVEIENIEKILDSGDIDKAKSLAVTKLEEIKGTKILEERVNSIINDVDKIISTAKSEILKYHTGANIEYEGMEICNDNGYSRASELRGKTLLHFVENYHSSPRDYMYNKEDGNIYSFNQGSIYWVNNNNKVIYTELQEEVKPIKISSEESRKIALDFYLSRHPEYSSDDIMVAMGDDINENNEYYRGIAPYMDDTKTRVGKPIADYYVNATTGEVRILWE